MSNEVKASKPQASPKRGNCPVCGSDSLCGESVELDSTGACQAVFCHDCGAGWDNIYVFEKHANIIDGWGNEVPSAD